MPTSLIEAVGGGDPARAGRPARLRGAAGAAGRGPAAGDAARAGRGRVAPSPRPLAWWAERADVMVVEGVGGLLCPLAEGTTVADLAVALDYPLVIVARRGLGTLNHTLLTVEAARRAGLRVAGVVLNGAEPTADRSPRRPTPTSWPAGSTAIAILAELAHHDDPAALTDPPDCVDWYHRARSPRHSARG